MENKNDDDNIIVHNITDENYGTQFLFDISNEIKNFYESPVIFLLKKNYSDEVFDAMCTIRSHFIRDEPNTVLLDDIVDFHLKWLHSVNEIETYKTHLHNLSKNDVCESISYTLDAISARYKYYQRYIQNNVYKLSNLEKAHFQTELEIVDEMHTEVTQNLNSKLTCFRMFTDSSEFSVKLNTELEELLKFLDSIYDDLSFMISKYINVHLPQLTTDLSKTLQQLVDEFHRSCSPSTLRLVEELKSKGQELGHLIHDTTAAHTLEISKVFEKIAIIEDRIKRLKNDKSSAVTALENKKEFLVKRLASLESLRINLNARHQPTHFKLDDCVEKKCVCEGFYRLKIFNNLLPKPEREKLVTGLCKLWNNAILGTHSEKSLISILSANELQEEFTDDIGTFHVDEVGRKIYKKDDDNTKYQLNEQNKLVQVSDDSNHCYFYDECGRYYIDQVSNVRVYRASDTESEYVLDSSGMLIKSKEKRDGVIYYYDSFGRYYINELGKHIYRDPDSISEYENDGLGNLVRIRTFMDMFDPCPDDANVTEDFRYLKNILGSALRVCIAEVILCQPDDPLKYLAARLIKFRENLEQKESMALEKEAIKIEREAILIEKRAAAERAALEAALFAPGGSEATYDSNISKYIHEDLDDPISVISK